MSHYGRLICEITGTTDPATADLIENLMRSERTGLDGLDERQFRDAVIEAVADAAELDRSGQLAMYCGAMGLTVPAAAA
jgi:hypothetical protein